MSKITVLIADYDKESINELSNIINSQPDMKVISTAKDDGEDALLKIRKYKPDIVLLELLLQYKDGLDILEELYNNRENVSKNPLMIVMTSFNIEFTLNKALKYGADYFITKPYNKTVIVKKIRELYNFNKNKELHDLNLGQIIPFENFHAKNIKDAISCILSNFGIATSLNGFTYLIDCIESHYECSDQEKSVTKETYPEVAKKHSSTVTRVERSIRNAINLAYRDYEKNKHKEVYGIIPLKVGKKKPSNKEFISCVVKFINSHENMFDENTDNIYKWKLG